MFRHNRAIDLIFTNLVINGFCFI